MFNYRHEQKSPLHLILHGFSITLFAIAWIVRENQTLLLSLAGVAFLLIFIALTFATLTITGQHDHITLVFGPVPIFRFRIRFSRLTVVEIGNTSVVDPIGISWIPFRGLTYKLWGNDCVRLKFQNRTIRVGTDDPERLARFLGSKVKG